MRHIPSMFFETLKKIRNNIIDCTFGLGNYFFIGKIKKNILFSFEKDRIYYKFSNKRTKNKNFINLNKILNKKKNVDIFSDLGSSINQTKKKNFSYFDKIHKFLIKSIKVLKGNGNIIMLCFNNKDYKCIIHFKKIFSLFIKKKTNIKSKEINIKKNQSSRCANLIILKIK
ncbi:hypothetical protein ACT2CC_00715 [Candidatus Vidania fulgoroideorum]